MKTAVYFESGLCQIVLTPDTEWEKRVLDGVTSKGITENALFVELRKGGFYSCQGGWTRQGDDQESLFVIIKPKTP